MSHTNDCNYCRYKYCFKFQYREWNNVARYIHKRSVACLTRTETIVFMYKDKPYVIEANTDRLHKVNEYLSINLIEPMTCEEAKDKGCGSCDYYWPNKSFPSNRDFEMLQNILVSDAELDLDIDVYDIFGDGLHHHCGITKITGKEDIKIWLKEAWNHER